jgi:prevent-host-death family protein
MDWQLQEAKQRFSELVRRALADGPQAITRHGEEVVVMVSAEDYRSLTDDKPDLKAFLLSGPDLSVLDLDRQREMPRDVELGETMKEPPGS